MNVVANVSLFCVVVCVALSSAENVNKNRVEGCFVQLLKAMGKLGADFQSAPPQADPLVCYYVTELATNMIKSTVHDDIRVAIPNDADCLTEKFDLHRTLFDIIKIRVIDNSNTLDNTEKQRQLEEARGELTNALEKIVVDCPTDKQKFINVFHISLATKNDTLEAHQTEYCLTKYAIDNKLLELGDAVVWNPHNIISESVECDGIIAVEKVNIEREVRNVLAALPKTSKHLDCIMDSYRTGNTFNSNVAMKVLTFLDLPQETKDSAALSHARDFSTFLRTSTVACVKKNPSAK